MRLYTLVTAAISLLIVRVPLPAHTRFFQDFESIRRSKPVTTHGNASKLRLSID